MSCEEQNDRTVHNIVHNMTMTQAMYSEHL